MAKKDCKKLCYLFFHLLPVIANGQGGKMDSIEIACERIAWNSSLAHDTAFALNENPNTLLVETVKERIPGKALDLGMGLGRNSIYLAMNGWDVTGVEITDEAMPKGLMEASKNKMSIDAFAAPKASCDLGINEWDLVVHVYKGCFDNSRVSKIAKALKPGGILVFEFFHRDAGIEMKRPALGCETNSIKKLIEEAGGFIVLRYTEEAGMADYGLKENKLIKLVAAKK